MRKLLALLLLSPLAFAEKNEMIPLPEYSPDLLKYKSQIILKTLKIIGFL